MTPSRVLVLGCAAAACAVSSLAFSFPSMPKLSSIARHRSSSRLFGMDEEEYERLGWIKVNKALMNISEEQTAMAQELEDRFGKYKGQDLKTVSDALVKFHDVYRKPMLPLYKEVVNKFIVNTHLSTVSPMFQMDSIFALGIVEGFNDFLKGYPIEEREKLFDAACVSLDFDPAVLRKEAESCRATWTGKTEADFVGCKDGYYGDLIKRIQGDRFFKYTELFGLGLIKLMAVVGVDVKYDSLAAWAKFLVNVRPERLQLDWDFYTTAMDKLTMGEELMKQIEIRTKKMMAERLEKKAKEAEEAAKKAAEEEEAFAKGSEGATPQPA